MAKSLAELVAEVLLPHPPQAIGVAVSGGSDSMALLHLLIEFCASADVRLFAVTVDHGLRSEAAKEAALVGAHCQALGVAHDVLVWKDWDGAGNLQQAARNARYSMMADWAHGLNIDTIAVGHTADDQAETVLMNLARRSGVDGLSGMRPRTLREGITWVRPLLQARRNDLQVFLQNHKITWFNDPSNENMRFERIKARKALSVLKELGIGTEALVTVAGHMSQARRALEWQAFLAAKQCFTLEAGAVVVDETMLRLQPDEIQRRLFVKAITWITGAEHSPRRNAIATVLSALKNGQAGTLEGCHLRRIGTKIWIFREYEAVRTSITPTNVMWDQRWQLEPEMPVTDMANLTVRALGPAGLEQCPDWRATGMPYVFLQSTPAIWDHDRLVAAPLAGYAQNWQAKLVNGPDTLFAALLSH